MTPEDQDRIAAEQDAAPMDGAFFTAAVLKNATMTELAEARARVGFCPSCQAKRLRYLSSGGGMVFRGCADCSAVVVLEA